MKTDTPTDQDPMAQIGQRGTGIWLLLSLIVLSLFSASITAKATSSADIGAARSDCEATVGEAIVDLKDLEKRIKKTKAVGMLTKIKLKNEINDLLKKMEAYHGGGGPFSIEQLQEQFDLLYLKIVSLAQDKDIDLHQQLCASWDLIWEYMQDSERFKQIT